MLETIRACYHFIKRRIIVWGKRCILFFLRGGFLLHHPGKPFTLSPLPCADLPSPDQPLRLCYVIGTLGPGGAERQLAGLAGAMARRGHNVHVLVMSRAGEDGHYLSLLEQAKVKVLTISRSDALAGLRECRKKHLRREAARFCLPWPACQKQVFAAAHCLRGLRPHVVHTYLDYANILFPLAALMADVPRVRLSLRSLSPRMYTKDRLMAPLEVMRTLYRGLLSSDRVSVEANSTAGARDYAQWLGIDVDRIAYAPNGITESCFSPAGIDAARALRQELSLPEDAPLIACVLRMTEEKRPLSVVEVARRVCARHEDARFLFVGTGPMHQDVERLIARHGLEKQVLMLGRRSDIPAILRASRALLLTSRIEGLPNTVMEAMFFGLPVVATDVGGVPDLVTHGQNGYIYDKDDMDGLAEGVCRVLDDPELGRRLGSAGTEKMRTEFALERIVENMESVYRALLAQPQ